MSISLSVCLPTEQFEMFCDVIIWISSGWIAHLTGCSTVMQDFQSVQWAKNPVWFLGPDTSHCCLSGCPCALKIQGCVKKGLWCKKSLANHMCESVKADSLWKPPMGYAKRLEKKKLSSGIAVCGAELGPSTPDRMSAGSVSALPADLLKCTWEKNCFSYW